MKLGRRAAYLRRCILTQELLAQHEDQTSVRKRVFEIHIQPVLLCSYAQFNHMLNVRNPEKELHEIEAEINNNLNKSL